MAAPIVTLTMNPAIDVSADAQNIRPNHKIRTSHERIEPGGGGINVAASVRHLGGESHAVFLSGGVVGRYLEELLDHRGQTYHNVRIEGRTRLSTSYIDRVQGCEFRFVSEGPLVSEAEWGEALRLVEGLDWQWLVGSGSLPPGVPADFYRLLAQMAVRRGGKFVVDSSGVALSAALGPGVVLIKPSLTELQNLIGRELVTRAEQVRAARDLVQAGKAEIVALTLGAEGAIVVSREEAMFMPAIQVMVRSTVGTGDGFAGAMVWSLARGNRLDEALRWAGAVSAEIAASDRIVCESRERVMQYFEGTLGQVVGL